MDRFGLATGKPRLGMLSTTAVRNCTQFYVWPKASEAHDDAEIPTTCDKSCRLLPDAAQLLFRTGVDITVMDVRPLHAVRRQVAQAKVDASQMLHIARLDNDQRRIDHFGGKVLAYQSILDMLDIELQLVHPEGAKSVADVRPRRKRQDS